ncbi:hypothetical protein BU24DRAFT_407574 [Aaosphaeria arxii CBS 175.79]|uniref:F-box domain-containing protein n=1 Tax=Aaosphaeria arxii CBS 175.79 TaxID=1450172 RepID=A0A6A5XXC9_9PLEO|nr:uncharacterized protein BU24DRAFT_407574 [Aaosphaeria arxii CBS 175.79]KAF2017553.1 hypothetical protein BU24DRAFT_407574 [Aaosphaeria arxii CBS 175.79]
MDSLPDEILLSIVSLLEPSELVNVQFVSHRFLRLSRDSNLWKRICHEHSTSERRRKRLQIFPDHADPAIVELLRAVDTYGGSWTNERDPLVSSEELQLHRNQGKKKAALLAMWDPSYSDEKVDWYQDFIQRHAPHKISWFQSARHGHHDDGLHHEATGAGILYDDGGLADMLIAPLEDGSISVWDASGSSKKRGGIIARSAVGLLPGKGPDLDFDTRIRQSQAIMTETGAVECVSIDSRQKKGFFAVQNTLNEVDLRTLQVISKTPYPFPITALSESRHPTPLTVGTNWTLHLHDTRKPPSTQTTARTELIGGAASPGIQTGDFGGHVSLSQPGALSILHLPTAREWDGNGDIWVGGRFTSMLNFDRRYFPRLRGTVHSGARLSCLTAIPHPFIPRNLRHNYVAQYKPTLLHAAKTTPGYTLITAGEYKGKGALEQYSLSSSPARSINSSPSSSSDSPTPKSDIRGECHYQNRQTCSSSKLLSVAAHGTRLVFSDGDGNLKWVERDGSTPVREFNINGDEQARSGGSGGGGRPEMESGWGEIVQKILPTVNPSLHHERTANVPLGEDNLVVWTGDGRLGTVGFGSEAFDAEGAAEAAAEAGLREEEVRLREREREYGAEMRRALEHQSRELRWLRGYGL